MVGTGWLTQTYNWWKTAGTFGASLAFLIAALALLPIAIVYGSVSRSLACNELEWAAKNIPSWLAGAGGAAAITAYALVVPWEAIQVAHILRNLLHANWIDRTAAPVLCALLLTIQMRGTRFNARAQLAGVAGLLAAVAGIAVTSIWTLVIHSPAPFAPAGFKFRGVTALIAIAPFYLSGFESGIRSIEDVDGAARPRVAVFSPVVALAIGTAVYATIPLFIAALPQCSVKPGVIAAADRLSCVISPVAAQILFAMIAMLSLLKCANGSLTASARGIWGAARSGLLPSAFAGRTALGVPDRALLFVTAAAVLLALPGPLMETPLSEGSSFGFVVSWEIVAMAYMCHARRAGRPAGVATGACAMLLGLGFLASLLYSWKESQSPLGPASGALVVVICALAGTWRKSQK
jgi:amino acid transporter